MDSMVPSKPGFQISPRTARWMPIGIAAGTVVLVLGGMALAYVDRHSLPGRLAGWDFTAASGNIESLAVPVVGLVITFRRPGNPIGWLFLAAGLSEGLWTFSTAYAQHALLAAPGSLPAGRAFALLANGIFVILLALLAFVFVLFPNGRLRSARWRPTAWFIAGAFTLAEAAVLVVAARLWSDPFSSAQQGSPPDVIAAVAT